MKIQFCSWPLCVRYCFLIGVRTRARTHAHARTRTHAHARAPARARSRSAHACARSRSALPPPPLPRQALGVVARLVSQILAWKASGSCVALARGSGLWMLAWFASGSWLCSCSWLSASNPGLIRVWLQVFFFLRASRESLSSIFQLYPVSRFMSYLIFFLRASRESLILSFAPGIQTKFFFALRAKD